jgi:hypothetical protein
MRSPDRHPARARLVAMICGWVAVIPQSALLLWSLVLRVTLSGSDRILLLTPGALHAYSAIAWIAFAIAAIVLGVRARSRLPIVLGAIAFVEVAIGIALLFVG